MLQGKKDMVHSSKPKMELFVRNSIEYQIYMKTTLYD